MSDSFGSIGKLAMGVVVLAIVLIVGFMIIAQGKDQIAETEGTTDVNDCVSIGCNASDSVTEALDDFPGWIPIVIIVGIGVILIGMVKSFGRG